MENLETKDFGELSVQVTPIGNFTGSDKDGNPVPEVLSEESLSALADKLNNGDEILADIDHASSRVGVNKDSSAAGWFSRFILDPIKGLFATLKLTKRGKELVENREYRYLSPTLILNDKGEPVDIHSISFTNVPAFKGHIKPILNSEASEINEADEYFTKDILSMDLNELKELISSMIAESKEADKKAEIVEEIKEEIVENKCSDEMKEVVANEETTEKISEEKTEVVEKTTEEKPVEETEKVEEEKEVIKIEALNSSPSIIKDVEPIWKKLKGKEFLEWASKNKNYQI